MSSHRSTTTQHSGGGNSNSNSNALLAVLGIFAVVGLKENGKLTAQTTFFHIFQRESDRASERASERKIDEKKRKEKLTRMIHARRIQFIKNVENENVCTEDEVK